jgi:hypothetical protein
MSDSHRGGEREREEKEMHTLILPPSSMSDSRKDAAWTLASGCYQWSSLLLSSGLWLRPQWPPLLPIWCSWLLCCLRHHHCPPPHSPVPHHHSGHLAQACKRRRHAIVKMVIRLVGSIVIDTCRYITIYKYTVHENPKFWTPLLVCAWCINSQASATNNHNVMYCMFLMRRTNISNLRVIDGCCWWLGWCIDRWGDGEI